MKASQFRAYLEALDADVKARISAITPAAALAFLDEAARYFESRPTGGEDAAHWANVYNSKNCRAVADLIRKHIKSGPEQ